MKGLIQAEKGRKNMEHMAEIVPDTDSQSLQHFISQSDWDEREVLNQVAKGRSIGWKDSCC